MVRKEELQMKVSFTGLLFDTSFFVSYFISTKVILTINYKKMTQNIAMYLMQNSYQTYASIAL